MEISYNNFMCLFKFKRENVKSESKTKVSSAPDGIGISFGLGNQPKVSQKTVSPKLKKSSFKEEHNFDDELTDIEFFDVLD